MDIKLFYEEKGKGFPLILLHGNGEDHEYFREQIDFFSKEYRVIALDTRGHGKSPRGEGELSIKRFACDLHDFMIERSIEKAVLAGFSDGGNIALEFSLKYPQAVAALILNGANLDPSGVKRDIQLPIEGAYKRLTEKLDKSQEDIRKAEILGLMVNQPDIRPEELKKLDMPVLVVVGTDDMIEDDHSRLIAQSIKNSSFKVIEGDHFVANKRPKEFNRIVYDFLSEIHLG